jgi:hypothetical protein
MPTIEFIGFQEKCHFSAEKIAESCEHNIDPQINLVFVEAILREHFLRIVRVPNANDGFS